MRLRMNSTNKIRKNSKRVHKLTTGNSYNKNNNDHVAKANEVIKLSINIQRICHLPCHKYVGILKCMSVYVN